MERFCVKSSELFSVENIEWVTNMERSSLLKSWLQLVPICKGISLHGELLQCSRQYQYGKSLKVDYKLWVWLRGMRAGRYLRTRGKSERELCLKLKWYVIFGGRNGVLLLTNCRDSLLLVLKSKNSVFYSFLSFETLIFCPSNFLFPQILAIDWNMQFFTLKPCNLVILTIMAIIYAIRKCQSHTKLVTFR